MICLLFSLRYQSQIRRTRPELYSLLENSILNIIRASCGTVAVERNYISASFNGEAIGFWLNMLTVLEGIRKIMDDAAPELYGYNCLIGQDLDEEDIRLVRLLPSGGSTGIWCDYSVQQTLSSYAAFENSCEEIRGISATEGYNRIRSFMSFSGREEGKIFPYREKIFKTLSQGSPKNAVLAGPRFIGKRDGLRLYCDSLLKGLPALRIVFGSGGNGMACFADMLTGEIRDLIAPFAGDGGMEKLDSLEEAIFQERFRRQYSAYFIQKTRRFMELLFGFYKKAVCAKKLKPVIILENINFADASSCRLFIDIFQDKIRTGYLVYGSFSEENAAASTDIGFDPWNKVFSRIIQVSPENSPSRPFVEKFEMIADLWEIAYTLSLFRRYFPSSLFPVLFKEAGVNPLAVSRALDIFMAQGIIDSREDPQMRIVDFDSRAERILGERKYLVRGIVSGRILAWVKKGGIKPCYNLLKVLADLGSEKLERTEGSETLVLNSITGDVINNTYREIEEDIRNNCFVPVVGEECFTAILYIFTTLCALIHKGEGEIRRAFLQSVPETGVIPEYKAHILSNLAGFNLGIYDIAAAQESIKEALILSQTRPDKRRLVQTYRLFSLVNICKQQVMEAIEYSDFAIECAERAGCFDELAITLYYAAGIHLLFGNLSKAGRLIRRADEYASITGRVEWADRSRFLLGKFRFEAGFYQEARDIFTGLLEQEFPGASKDRDAVLRAWIYRSRVFLNQSPGNLSGVETPDARLFEIEAAYITGEYRRTVDLADALHTYLSDLPENRFIFIEQPDWRSGFAQCELLLFSPKNFFTRLSSAYRALALAKLSADTGSSSAGEMALDGIRKVIREEDLPQTDPNDVFYYYSQYRVVQETGAATVDMDTAVSIAFKRLQSRASHIDDIETKRAYLSLNYWNNALGQAAKVHRLI
jgi:tetratricopeptide (TPR) repeat protein